uniref:Ground-like domain-containing protein n=1 Tax=Panagrellus redivivus TaxID=6233 RepID=A0A7E4VRI1_PANRE
MQKQNKHGTTMEKFCDVIEVFVKRKVIKLCGTAWVKPFWRHQTLNEFGIVVGSEASMASRLFRAVLIVTTQIALANGIFYSCCTCPAPLNRGCVQQTPVQTVVVARPPVQTVQSGYVHTVQQVPQVQQYQPVQPVYEVQQVVQEPPVERVRIVHQPIIKHIRVPVPVHVPVPYYPHHRSYYRPGRDRDEFYIPRHRYYSSYEDDFDPFFRPPPPPPPRVHEVVIPVIYRPVKRITTTTTPAPPKDSCYTNDSGFKCCNGDLETTMHSAYSTLKASPTFNDCNIGLMAKVVQKAAQKRFRLSFETIVSLKPFGANSLYDGNYTCRFERDGKYFLSYATPVQYGIDDAKSESTLNNADASHDDANNGGTGEVTDDRKQEKVGDLNAGLKDVKSTGVELHERVRKAILADRQHVFLKQDNFVRFDAVNSTSRSESFITHEITMGSVDPLISVRRRRSAFPQC